MLRELTWFVRCCRSAAGAALLDARSAGERVFPIDAETAREGLALARSSTSINVVKFEELPDAPGAPPQPLNAAWLRKAFPLIRRVDAEVHLSQRLWDLSGMQGAGEWVLLDFPGLGAAESGVRDALRSLKQGGWDDEDEEPALKLPTDSREFFEPFKHTLQQNEASALDCIRRAVREQLAALAKRTRPLVEDLALLLADSKTRERVEEFDRQEKEQGGRAGGKGQWNIFCWAVNPAGEDVYERFLATYVTDGRDPIAAETCFPLAGADPNQTPLRFPSARTPGSIGGNQQVLVLRLRAALADGMRRRVLQRVSQLNKQVLDGLKDTFTTPCRLELEPSHLTLVDRGEAVGLTIRIANRPANALPRLALEDSLPDAPQLGGRANSAPECGVEAVGRASVQRLGDLADGV